MADKHHAHTNLLLDSIINCSGTLVSSLLGLLTVPVLLQALGTELYGLWIAALSLAGIVGSFDLGLEWILTREVAEATGAGDRARAAPFVRSAGLVYLLLGIAGGLLVALAGMPFGRFAGHGSGTSRLGLPVFALAGVSLGNAQLLKFSVGVLEGMRRFGVINLLTSVLAFVRAMGIVLLASGADWLLLVWCTALELIGAFAALVLVGHYEPRFRSGSLMRLPDAMAHLRFGLLSQINSSLTKVVWESGPIILGALAGPAAVVALHIGQRPALVLSLVGDRAASVIFPSAGEAAGKAARASRSPDAPELLRAGTRSVLVLALPAGVIAWILAPALLSAWIPGVNPEAIPVARISIAAALLDAIAITAVHVCWGGGGVGRLTWVSAACAAIGLALTACFARAFSAAGAAVAFLVAIGFGSVLNFRAECRHSGIRPLDLLAEELDGLLMSVLAGVAAAAGVLRTMPGGRTPVILSCLAGCVIYAAVFLRFAANEKERELVRRMLGPLNFA